MAFQVSISKKAQKNLENLPKFFKTKVLAALVLLQKNPFAGKKLQGKWKNFYSFRIWPYRIIYSMKEKELLVFIIIISHRQGSYKKL